MFMKSLEAAESLRAFPADRLKQAFAWLDQTKGVPKKVAIAKDATIWLTRVDLLREREEELLEKGDYDKALVEHRLLLSSYIAEGERIIYLAKKAGISEFPSHFTLSDFEAAVDSVRLTFRCQHTPENTPAINDLIGKLLNGS